MPESPRWLISKDRSGEAFAILVKYHAEGDRNSVLVAAEFAQIESTLKLELENSKQSWSDLFRTSGMRKRVLIGSLLGLFTQWVKLMGRKLTSSSTCTTRGVSDRLTPRFLSV